MRIIAIIMGLFVLLQPPEAAAYIDPGTGSYIFQVLIAAVLGGLVSIKLFWRRIMAFIHSIFSKPNKP